MDDAKRLHALLFDSGGARVSSGHALGRGCPAAVALGLGEGCTKSGEGVRMRFLALYHSLSC